MGGGWNWDCVLSLSLSLSPKTVMLSRKSSKRVPEKKYARKKSKGVSGTPTSSVKNFADFFLPLSLSLSLSLSLRMFEYGKSDLARMWSWESQGRNRTLEVWKWKRLENVMETPTTTTTGRQRRRRRSQRRQQKGELLRQKYRKLRKIVFLLLAFFTLGLYLFLCSFSSHSFKRRNWTRHGSTIPKKTVKNSRLNFRLSLSLSLPYVIDDALAWPTGSLFSLSPSLLYFSYSFSFLTKKLF